MSVFNQHWGVREIIDHEAENIIYFVIAHKLYLIVWDENRAQQKHRICLVLEHFHTAVGMLLGISNAFVILKEVSFNHL